MDPERAHGVGMFFLRYFSSQQKTDDDGSFSIKTSFGEIKNPIGLAAGFDKTGRHVSTLQKLGFGYIVAGTITLDPWQGHPKPRIVRNPKDKTLLNCLGFPNPGADEFIQNIRKQKIKIPLIASISGRTESSILECYNKLQPHVSAIELNLSSPNTKNLKDLRQIDAFKSLVQQMSSNKKKCTYLKVLPFNNEPEQVQRNMEMIKVWEDQNFEGVTASNAIPVNDPRLSVGNGGLSGPPLYDCTYNAVKEIRKVVSPKFEINSVGGVSNAEDARKLLKAGATTVQLYASLVYQGPGLIRDMLRGLSGERKRTSASDEQAYVLENI